MHTPLDSAGARTREEGNPLTLDYVKAPPRFEKLAYPEWRDFVKKFKAYRQRRGRQPIKSQFGDDVLTVLELRVDDWEDLTSDEEVFNAVDLLYAPGSKLETIDRLESIKCTTSDREFSLDAIVHLINSFKEVIRLSAAAGTEVPEKMLKRLFVKSIKPERLKMVVEAEEPKTWTEAARFAIGEVERFSRNAKELTGMTVKQSGLPSTAKTSTGVTSDMPAPESSSKKMKSSETESASAVGERKYHTRSREPVCYGCGRQGHTRNKCRFKDVPGFQAEGFRVPPKLKIPESFHVKSMKTGSDTDNLLRVTVLVGSRTVQALIDTGSAISTVSPGLLSEIRSHTPGVDLKERKIDKSVITANKSVTQCDTAVWLPTVIQQAVPVAVDHEFVVMDTGEALLLGMDILLPTGLLHHLPVGSIEDLQQDRRHADDKQYRPNEIPVFPEEEEVDIPEEGKTLCDTSDIIAAHHTVFDEDQLMLGARGVPAMDILIKDGAQPPHAVNPRQMSPNLKEALREELNHLRKSGIIRKMDTSEKIITTAPIVMVKKKDHTWRLCVDYRNLNKVIRPQPFPMENVQELLRRLQGATIFAVLDLRKGFHQMSLTPESAALTAGDRTELNRNLKPIDMTVVKKEPKSSDEEISVQVQEVLDKTMEAQRIILDSSEKHQKKVLKERTENIPNDKLQEGDLVLLAYPDRTPTKLTPRWRGPLAVVSHNKQSSLVEVQCILTNRIYKVHVNRLKLYNNSRDIPPADIAAVDIDHYTVESIAGHRVIDSKVKAGARRNRDFTARDMEFKVKWLGYDEEDDTWMHYSEIKSLSALEKYLVSNDIRR